MAALLWYAAPAYAETEREAQWTLLDTSLQVANTALFVIDWRQSQEIARKGHSEGNLALGEHPSVGTVNTYFTVAILGHAAVSYLLPKPYRTMWQGVWIGVETGAVIRNYSMGISGSF